MDILLLGLLSLAVIFIVKFLFTTNSTKKQAETPKNNLNETVLSTKNTETRKVKVLYGSQTGTAKQWALKLAADVKRAGFEVVTHDLANYDPDNLSEPNSIILFVISTYTDGRPPDSCAAFYQWLEDFTQDFRVTKTHYQHLKYAVLGIGNSVYGKQFNTVARNLDKMVHSLSAQRIIPVGLADNGAGVEIEDSYVPWSKNLLDNLLNATTTSATSTTATKSIKTSEEPDEDEEEEESSTAEPLVDMEDLGKVMKKSILKKKKKIVTSSEEKEEQEEEEEEDEEEEEEEVGVEGKELKEMLTPSLSKALTKQGYKLLGSHSGVKLCRWTKAMLRGRGGCYKHTFYGIQSFQCMEMTPSLACANKCVFCWRHHKNPVGKEWKWKVDEPEFLVEQAIKNHQQMIKQMKGVPGVDKEKFEEAFTVKHCALSLVGEPIIYPHINQFVDLLHSKKISSFLVTNAQFPDKIDSMKPVTQLYISVDAGTKESLKKIDRPLFADFWERFLACIDSLSLKGQRTVFRLTLVKEWNMEEIKNYAQLIERGMPSFVEIKGVTYCGTSNASSLTIKNVPFHEEVLKFCSAIIESSPKLSENYEISCEHEHSCCVLISHKRFKINGKWNTWIDYEKFHKLATSGVHFTDLDYAAETPSWAVVGSEERGFDPEEIRFRRNKPYQNNGC